MRETKKKIADGRFYDRLKKITGCRNMAELSLFFGVSHSTISAWRERSALPADQKSYLRLRGLNPDWLDAGQGGMLLNFPPGEVPLRIHCPLKADLIKMLAACESCAAWAGIIKTNLQ